jgi:DNA-3-methyladenine glycosylase
MGIIPRKFYARGTITVARELLGKSLVRKTGKKTISGIITETEAYRYKDDPASHAFRGMTERNKVMFGQVGLAYVYFTYGMYYCVNVVAKGEKHEAGGLDFRKKIITDKRVGIKNGVDKLWNFKIEI